MWTYLLNVRWCSIFATLGYRPAHRIALTSFKFSEKDTKVVVVSKDETEMTAKSQEDGLLKLAPEL